MSDREYEAPGNLEVMAEAINYNKFLVDLVVAESTAGGKVLDFGAGIGTFATAVALELGSPVVYLEPDLRQRQVMESVGLECVATINDLASNSFDVVYTPIVLEHIEDDVTPIRELLLRLKPSGKLLFYVPALPILYSAMDTRVGHVRRYRRKELVTNCQEAGFEVERIHFADFLGVPATLTYKAMGPKDGAINSGSVRTFDRFVFPLSRFLDRLFGMRAISLVRDARIGTWTSFDLYVLGR